MTLRELRKLWDHFFFTPQSPLPIALFRILYGLCVSATLALLHADWLNWYGVHSWVSLSAMRQEEPGIRLNLFTVFPQDDGWTPPFFWVFPVWSPPLTAGLFSALNTLGFFLCLSSLHQRNPLILHGGDAFLRII